MIPARDQIEASSARARAALGELRGYSRDLKAEVQFARWLHENDPGDVGEDQP